MKIAVCIKQVPDVKDIQWTENNTMKREGVESVINPCDLYALEFALRCKKDVLNSTVTAITMGPNQAEKILRQAIALGVDDGVLLSDRRFSGADTLATGRTLSQGIKKAVEDFDIIFCGQFASDGDTAQTGVEIAENLNCNQVTYVKNILEINKKSIKVLQEMENYTQEVEVKFPCVLCVMENSAVSLSNALIAGQMNAQDSEINVLSLDDLEIDNSLVGIKGSPTYVCNVFRPIHNRKGELINADNAINFCKNLVDEVLQR